MQLPIKITFVTVGSIVFISVLFPLLSGTENLWDNVLASYGILGLLSGALCLLVSLLLFASGKKNHGWARGFLLSAGLLLLTGFFAMTQVPFGRA